MVGSRRFFVCYKETQECASTHKQELPEGSLVWWLRAYGVSGIEAACLVTEAVSFPKSFVGIGDAVSAALKCWRTLSSF